MRRLTDESGATTVIVAILLVVLLGLGALVVDVGSLYWERRELQNGADAAALALVQECMDEGLPCTSAAASTSATASTYANANAADGVAESLATLDPVTCEADVTTSTLTSEGGTLVPAVLARAIVEGYDGTTVTAQATADCGGIAAGGGIPLIFDQEGWHNADKVEKPDGAPNDWWETWTPGDDVTDDIFFQQGTGYGSGAFGWLNLDAGEPCYASLDQLGQLVTNTGNSFSCDFHNGSKANAEAFEAHILSNNPHLVPMYSSYTGNGNNLTYQVSGFAVIYITGWHFSGNHYQYNAPCSGNERCISGHFLTSITMEEHQSGGGDFGVYSYGLTG